MIKLFWRFLEVIKIKSYRSLVYTSSAAFKRARPGRQLSSDTKNAIVELDEGRHSGRKISSMLGINPVQMFLK